MAKAIKRYESLVFLNVGTVEAAEWAWLNEGVEAFGVDFNEDVERRNYIGNKNSTVVGGKSEKSAAITQYAHKGDEVFDFIDNIFYNEYEGEQATTELLEVFVYKAESDAMTAIPAKKSKVLITKGTHNAGDGGEQLQLVYAINFQGDPDFIEVALADGEITVKP